MTYISALPTPPSRSDDPAGFSNKADALLAALPDFVTEANTLSDEVDAMRDDTEAKRAATETLRDETSTLKGQAESARDLALSYKDTANTYRGQAEDARDSAQVIAAAYGGELGLPSLTDKSLSVMRVNEGETGVEWGPATPALDSMVTLTSGTSWTCPDGVRMAVLRGVGGCGGGGCGETTPSSNTYGSGAAGGEFEAIVDLVAGTTYTYAIGAGGAAAAANNTEGGTGGTTSITIGGVTFSATGGNGGVTASTSLGAIGGKATAAGGIAKYGLPGRAGAYGIGFTPGVVSSLGTKSGDGSNSGGATAGGSGKIVMELYK